MKFAVPLALVAFVAVAVAEEFRCQAGVPYVENECNSCFCAPDGQLGCTEKACLGPKNTQLKNCQVGTTYAKGCNRCWCDVELGTVCSNKKC